MTATKHISTHTDLYEAVDVEPQNAQPGESRALRKDTFVAIGAVMVGMIAALVYAALSGIDNWSQLVVLGGIVLTTISVMIATDPLRRG
jgi:hypothetical protein